jgi:glucose-6-phosphate isomerase
MTDFMNYKSVLKLQELAKTQVDLTDPKILTKERIKDFQAQNCGLKFLYGCEKINEEIISNLFDLAKESECLKKMKDMQEGVVVNFIEGQESDNRKVLHTSLRDFFEDRIQEEEAKEASELAYGEIEKLKVFIDEINKEDKFTDIVQVGIGGSILGPKSMYYGLKCYSTTKRRAHFISNIDPDEIASLVKEIDLSKTLVVCVSKSGSTLETLTNEEFLKKEFINQGLNPNDHFVAVTCKNSKMDDEQKYLKVFYIWDYICGRFSPTSMVGGVLLSFSLGFDLYMELLDGANKMDKVALSEKVENNLPLLAALIGIWNRNFLNYKTLGVIPYSSSLLFFCSLLQQYEMESNGKTIDQKAGKVDFQTCPIVWGDIGCNAQHSFFQYLHQGTDITPLVFIGFEKSQYNKDIKIQDTTSQEKLLSNLFAQTISLAIGKKDENPNKNFEGNRPSSILLAERLTPFSMGAIMSFFEHKAAFEGFIWGINSFDQEGVQLGKVLAENIMEIFSGKDIDFSLAKAFINELGIV